MSDVQRNLFIGIAAAVALSGGIYYFATRSSLPATGGNLATSTTPTTSVGGVVGSGDYTVEVLAPEPPKLTAISITADLSAEAKTILRQKIEAQYEILRREPTRVDVWLQLGVNRKIGGDFEGAIEAWDYVAITAPPKEVGYVAYGNLGDLYLYFLKNYDKAEANYEQAISLSPTTIEYYRGLFYLLKDIRKDPAAAARLIERGLAANPNHPDLLSLKSRL